MSDKQDPGFDIERAWKDAEYRKNLTPEQLDQLPPNPAGDITLSEEELDSVAGGRLPYRYSYKCEPTTF